MPCPVGHPHAVQGGAGKYSSEVRGGGALSDPGEPVPSGSLSSGSFSAAFVSTSLLLLLPLLGAAAAPIEARQAAHTCEPSPSGSACPLSSAQGSLQGIMDGGPKLEHGQPHCSRPDCDAPSVATGPPALVTALSSGSLSKQSLRFAEVREPLGLLTPEASVSGPSPTLSHLVADASSLLAQPNPGQLSSFSMGAAIFAPRRGPTAGSSQHSCTGNSRGPR